MSLDLLRTILKDIPSMSARPGDMPVDELRFVIEFASPPDAGEVQLRLTGLLESSAFVLEPMFSGRDIDPLGRFLLMRIPGVQRTLPADMLFETAYAIATALGAVSVEPDVGSGFFEEPVPPDMDDPQQRELAAAVSRWCNVDDAAPKDPMWVLGTTQVLDAWQMSTKKGDGVIVAQPDTGVTAHPELADDALDFERAYNILNPGQPPTDPLSASMSNPGHGTAAASCVVSRGSGSVTGAAPAARLAPIRCINDVKVFDASPVARAIDHARRVGCHVITMSLGGVPSRALHEALKAAVNENLIVLAAAGNCVRFVVWPARYSECIAVAGTNIDDIPWKGSSRGSAVDISAPAENVWKADPRSGAPSSVTPGQGTTFAVAITAGIAALWLAHHGRDTLIAEARARGVKLQDLFRSALMQTARRPTGWNAGDFGAGIVDARALQALDPKQIRIVRKEGAESATPNEIAELVAELSQEGAIPPAGFDWNRYGLELANVMMEARRQEIRARSGTESEAGSRADRPSPTLVRALEGTPCSALELVRNSRATGFSPTSRRAPTMAPATGTLRVLASSTPGSGLESASAPLSISEAVDLLRNNRDSLIDAALRRLASVSAATGAPPDAVQKLEQLLNTRTRPAMDALAQQGNDAGLDAEQRASLEALVQLTGRPALRVRNDNIDLNDADIGEWKSKLFFINKHIPRLARSVGRIDIDGNHVGTGFMIAEDLVMTNRHVLEAIAAPLPTRVRPTRWVLINDHVTIDFRREQGSGETHRFAILEAVFSGPDPTNDSLFIDFADLDLAVLRIAPRSSENQAPPPPLPFLKGELETHSSTNVLVLGFPAHPKILPTDAQGNPRQDIVEALLRIYGLYYGFKYLSPGEVSALPGQVASDPRQWIFSHDATTLGGNSGSCVLRYGPEPAIIGLHFAGEFERANYAHAMLRVTRGEHLPPALLERLDWVQE